MFRCAMMAFLTYQGWAFMADRRESQKVLVLQGGGALGAYQAGVFEALQNEMFKLDWVVGTSIGAINGAIIAGNEPSKRVERLKEFWSMTGKVGPQWEQWEAMVQLCAPWMGQMASMAKTAPFLLSGIPGFFVPRQGDMAQALGGHARSYYDTDPLEKTLERLVDFDYLNDKPCRYTACAVDVDSGELACFDTEKIRVEPRHVMASGALPPGFPSVFIDGRRYWDGGLYSNTPIDVVLADAERKDTVCVMVDLWASRQESADTISAAMGRQKDIQYASRVREHLRQHREMQNMRRAIHELAEELPAAAKRSARVKSLIDRGCPSSINLCRLVMKPLPEDDQYKDIDFRPLTVDARWAAGMRDGGRLLGHKSWLAPLPAGVGMSVHELKSDDNPSESIKP
jgi:NTE family protein